MTIGLKDIKKMLHQQLRISKIVESFRLSLGARSRVVYKGKEYNVIQRMCFVDADEIPIRKTDLSRVKIIKIADIEKLIRHKPKRGQK